MSKEPADDATVAFEGKRPEIDLQIPGYKILRQLGHGGMGAVYLGEDEALGRKVAIKVVADAIARDAAIRARFLREARLLATVEHPNVVRVYSFAATEERAYLVMEYVEGETLADRIQRGPMPIAEAKEIIARVADALDAAWEKRIVHRDIKPSNILFDRRGNLKVADFGLAKGTEGKDNTDSSLTQTGYLLGSPHYVAPEQAQGQESDFRADIYSLGVTFFEMLTGRKPFEGGSALAIISKHLHDDLPSLTSFRRDAGPQVASLVARMTKKNPADRPSSYTAVKEALDALDVAASTIITKREKRPRPKLLRTITLSAALLCALATVVLFFAFHNRQAPLAARNDDRLVVAVTPFWGPDKESLDEGRSMAALVQQQLVTRLGSAAKVIGIEETKTAVRDADSARALGEKLDATAVIWGQAFAMRNEREIQPSLTLIPRKQEALANYTNGVASLAERRNVGGDLPATPEAIRIQAGGANQLDMRRTSAEGIGDLVTFLAVIHALRQDEPQRALELLTQTRKTPDALYQKAICLANMKRDDDATKELNEALKLDPAHAPSLAMLADIDARASRFADAAAHLRAAAATGRRFTTSETALYNDTLYVMERYIQDGTLHDTPTMLAIDPVADRVLDRWELPGPPRVFNVEDSGLTVKVDMGPPRSGELMALHFVKDHFAGRPLPHVGMAGRIRLMKPGWLLPINFTREMGAVGLRLPVSHFRYSPIDADPTRPKTLPELKAALEKAIARDPTQPWHRLYLALTVWELGDHAAANRIFDEMLAQPNKNVPYYVFSWMPRTLEPLQHRDWADRAYAEALKRRTAESLPITTTATVERMLDAPFVRRATYNSIVSPDPARDHLWLARARELTGWAWNGDSTSSAAWARYFRLHGDPKTASEEEAVHELTQDAFGGMRAALTIEDLMRAAQVAILISLLVVIVLALRGGGIAALGRQERRALTILAILLVVCSAARFVGASRARLVESIPVPSADNLHHPVILSTLEQILAERDSNELRFITAYAYNLAGDAHRAVQLYQSVPWRIATENADRMDLERPQNPPTTEMYIMAFHRLCPYALLHTLRAAWRPQPQADSPFSVAEYEASQTFYLSLLLAAAMLLLAAGAANVQRGVPALAIAIFVVAAGFTGFALTAHRTWSKSENRAVSGKYSAEWRETFTSAHPFPPETEADLSASKSPMSVAQADEIAERRASLAMARSEAMHLYWTFIAIGALAALASGALLVRGYARRRREVRAPLLDQAADVKA